MYLPVGDEVGSGRREREVERLYVGGEVAFQGIDYASKTGGATTGWTSGQDVVRRRLLHTIGFNLDEACGR